MNVLDAVPEPHRTVIADVLSRLAPQLLSELKQKSEPSPDEWDAVTGTLYKATTEHWLPGWDLDERGLEIDYAMGAFINAFIHVNDREDRTP